MRELILARHAESIASFAGIVDGDPELAVDLTAKGEEQARMLAYALNDRPLDLCVTSEFLRTRRTADLALTGRRVPRLVLADFNDMRFGELQGASIHSYRAWVSENGIRAAPKGGESRLETVTRFVGALRTLQARPEPSVLAVTHGLTIAYLQTAASEEDLDAFPSPPPYASVHIFDAEVFAQALDRLASWLHERTTTCSSN